MPPTSEPPSPLKSDAAAGRPAGLLLKARASHSMRPRDAARAAPERSRQWLGIVLGPGELERTLLLFGLLFLAALVLVVGRSARDALFLTQFPVTWIAPMWMAYAGASAVLALAYTPILSRLTRARFVVGFMVIAIVTYAILWALIQQEVRAAYAIFYIWSEVLANFTAVLCWTVAQDLHDARSAKRLFGVIGAGRVLGTLVCGFATGLVVTWIGTVNLLFVLMAAFGVVALITRRIDRVYGLPGATQANERGVGSSAARMPVLRSRYVITIAAMTLLLFTILTIGDYQFKAIAKTAYPARDDLARFMANFYGVLGAVGIVVQLFITPRLLQRYGVLAGIVFMPLCFVSSSAALILAPSLMMAAVMKGSDNGLQFTIHDATMQMLFFPFPAELRERVRTQIGAIWKPLGYGVGAVLLVFLAPAQSSAEPGPELVRLSAQLGFITLPLGFLVIALMPLVRSGYVKAMRRTLTRREIEPLELENNLQARPVLIEALHSSDSPQVLFAVDHLRVLDPAVVRDALPDLARHASARVRALSLRLTFDLGYALGPDLARAALSDPDQNVRVTAIEVLASHLREDAHDELAALASQDEDAAMRAAAIAALVRHCGLDGMLDGAPRLRALLESKAPEDRIAAADVLGMVGEASLQRALARLLRDADPDVRRAAVKASRSVCDPRLLPLLLDALAERALATAAGRAIVALGEAGVGALALWLGDPQAPRASRLAIPRLLARLDCDVALAALVSHLDEPDEVVRQKVLASASRLRLSLNAPPLPFNEVRSRIDREIREHESARDAYLAARPTVARPLLDEHVIMRLRKGLVRILRLCELAYPRTVVASVRAHVFGSDSALRANAFEVLESLVDRAVQERLVALVERFVAIRSGAFGGGRAGASEERALTWIRSQLEEPEAYRAALALDAVAYRKVVRAGPDALRALAHRDPFVRETAAIAVAVTMPEGAREALESLVLDPDPVVAAYARYWVATGSAGLEADDDMYTTIEKVLFLQRIPVFARVAGEDLVTLSRGSQVVSLDSGSVIFREGDKGGALYFVISGAVVLRVAGREVATLGPDDVFGEMSIFDSEPRAATAMVAEDAELLRVSAADFREAVRDTGEIAIAVIQTLNRRLREADRRLVASRSAPPPEPQGAAKDAEKPPEESEDGED